jgi:type VI secretion system protein ImpH
MASPDRTSTHAVALFEALRREPYAFHFFQALRRLECLYRDQPRLGQSIRLADDPIRLAQQPSMAFAPSTLAAFEPGDGERPARLYEYFLGLFGPNGPLPLHLTEYVRDRSRNVRRPHLSLFRRSVSSPDAVPVLPGWADAQPTVSYDRPETDRFNVYIGAPFGMGMPSLWNRDAAPDLAKFHYAGRLVSQTRNPEGCKRFWGIFSSCQPIVETFVGHWLPLDPKKPLPAWAKPRPPACSG